MSNELARADDQWLADFRERHGYCCGHVRFDAWDGSAVIKHRGAAVGLNFVCPPGFLVVRRDLLDVLSPEIKQLGVFGKLTNSEGAELPDILSVSADRKITIRGGADSTRWICQGCGQFIYDAMGVWYILERDLGEAAIYTVSPVGLLVNEQLRARLRAKRWKKLVISKMRIATEPRDGLPADLRNVTEGDILRSLELAPPKPTGFFLRYIEGARRSLE